VSGCGQLQHEQTGRSRILTYIELCLCSHGSISKNSCHAKTQPPFVSATVHKDAARESVFLSPWIFHQSSSHSQKVFLSRKVFRRRSFVNNRSQRVFRKKFFAAEFSTSSFVKSFIKHLSVIRYTVFMIHYSLSIRLITVLF